jgi:hypothetical protein
MHSRFFHRRNIAVADNAEREEVLGALQTVLRVRDGAYHRAPMGAYTYFTGSKYCCSIVMKEVISSSGCEQEAFKLCKLACCQQNSLACMFLLWN